MDYVKYCDKCRNNNMPPGCPGYYAIPNNYTSCLKCKTPFKILSLTYEEWRVLRDNKVSLEFIDAMVELKDKDIIEFETKMAQFRVSAAQIKAAEEKAKEEANKPKCPKCKSTNIQIVPRKWSFWTGVFTNKTDRVCANCKYKW